MAKKGIKFTEEHKAKLSETKKRDRHWNWQGGKKADNPNYTREWAKKYKKLNRDKYLVYNGNRRARLRNSVGKITLGEWELLKIQYGFICPCCKKQEPEIKLTIDHIIPLSKGGVNIVENIQPLCQSCNSSKKTKIMKYVQ